MNRDVLISARKSAEAAVADMPSGDLKVAAFQTILAKLLDANSKPAAREATQPAEAVSAKASGTTGRLLGLIQEGFFAQQRSLADIQKRLAENGWHYPQEHLGTPLTRIVRKKQLRRTQVAEGGKKIWKYSVY